MPRPRKQPVINFDNEPAMDAFFAGALKLRQDRLEREKQPVPSKPREVPKVLPSGRLNTLRPSCGRRP